MVISSARRTMSQKKRTQISRFLRKDRSFQMTQVLIISKRRVSLKVKIQNIIRQMWKLQIKMIKIIKKNNVSYSLLKSYIFKICIE
jgi:hypothetical protein